MVFLVLILKQYGIRTFSILWNTCSVFFGFFNGTVLFIFPCNENFDRHFFFFLNCGFFILVQNYFLWDKRWRDIVSAIWLRTQDCQLLLMFYFAYANPLHLFASLHMNHYRLEYLLVSVFWRISHLQILLSDLKLSSGFLQIFLKKSKTDELSQGHWITLQQLSNSPICPAFLVQQFLQFKPSSETHLLIHASWKCLHFLNLHHSHITFH